MMRRVARHLFTLCSALSLMLCVTMAVLWVWSYWREQTVSWENRTYSHDVTSAWGMVRFTYGMPIDLNGHPGRTGWDFGSFPAGPRAAAMWVDARHPTCTGFGGFAYCVASWPKTFFVPHWFFALATALLPAVKAIHVWTSWRRLQLGLCRRCGYDLRASPDRCSECGAAACQ